MNNRNQELVIMNEHNGRFENDVNTAIRLLIDNSYILVVRTELTADEQIIIDYSESDESIRAAYPYFLYPEEYEQIEMTEVENNG